MACAALRDGRLERVLPGWVGTSLALYATVPTRKHLPARSRALIDFLVDAFGGEDRDPWLDLPATGSTPRRPTPRAR